jgi:3-oxoadipate enol-lactonase
VFAPPRITVGPVLLVLVLVSSDCRLKDQRNTVAPVHVDSGTVAVKGTQLFYEEAGHGSAVILIHGGNLDRRMWDPQFLQLARDHRVIRYDLRGFGKSGDADIPYQAHEDLRALLAALHIDRAALVGLSGGARIAIDFALAHPERVDRLVLAAPGLSGWQFSNGDTLYFPEARRARALGDAAGLGLAWLGSEYMRPAMEHPELVPRLKEIAADNGKNWMGLLARGSLELVAEPPALHRTAMLRAPTPLVVGTRDTRDIQAIADTLAMTVRDLRRVTFEGAGHMLNMEQPSRFTTLVRDFLRP